jgi:hypothetical protein
MNAQENLYRQPLTKFFIAWFVLGIASMDVVSGAQSKMPTGYIVETVPIPAQITLGVGGLAFAPDGALFVTTREGQVWRLENEKWSLFADGLHEVLGIYIDPVTSDTWVMQRPELTQLIDEDGDGVADVYRTVNAEWGLTDNYHEYAFGIVRDSEGNFYGTLNTSLSWVGWAGSSKWDVGRVHDGKMGRAARYRGWSFQVTKDGRFIPWSSGMRSPAGIGMNRQEEIFYTDNQGDWNGSSTLQHVVKGRFHGHPSSLMDHPDFQGQDLNAIAVDTYRQLRTPPAVFFIHGDLANSPGEPVFNETGGQFGPFENQVFVGDQTRSNLMRVYLEKVQGTYQGAIFNFIDPMQSGIVRNQFDKHGVLYVGQTGRGWRSVGSQAFGLEKVRWDRRTTPVEMHSVRLTTTGFEIRFTQPMSEQELENPLNYAIRHWHYLYRPEYGSPKVDPTKVSPRRVRVSHGGMRVHLEMPLVKNKVYEFKLLGMHAQSGGALTNPIGWYTLNRLRLDNLR